MSRRLRHTFSGGGSAPSHRGTESRGAPLPPRRLRLRHALAPLGVAVALGAAAGLLAPSGAHAQDQSERSLTAHRAVPDYDGRDAPGPDVEDVLIYIPRVLFAPVTLVLEYMVRRPLAWLATETERLRLPLFVVDLLTWDQLRAGVVPTVFVGFGLQPSVGLYYFSNDQIAPGHQVRVAASFGGVDYLTASGSYRIRTEDNQLAVAIDVSGTRRPDNVFSGVGWDAQPVQYRYREDRYHVAAEISIAPWRASRMAARVAVDGHAFDPNGYAALAASPNDASLGDALDRNLFAAPAGLRDGYVAYRQGLELALDSRRPAPHPGHGVRAEVYAELGIDLGRPDRGFVHYGGGAGGYVDVGHRRVIGLWTVARFVDRLGAGEVPFTELVTLGGRVPLLAGFLNGQLRGQSGAATVLDYTYPVWTQLDGRLHVAVGNAFGPHLSDFAFERLRLSFGLGLSTIGDPGSRLEVEVAAGTEPFASGADIVSVQLLFGSRGGF